MRKRMCLMTGLYLAAAGWSWSAQNDVTIALYNYADLPPAVLDSAKTLVQRTLENAGIRAAWSICLTRPDQWVSGCAQRLPSEGRYIVLNIMRKRRAPPLGPGLGYELAGYAIQDSAREHGARAFAFYDSVEKIAQAAHRRPGVVLACVLMHEIAHTLGLRHGAQGVMRPVLDPHAMDEAARGLAFNSAQARQLRRGVAALNRLEE